LLNIAKLVTPQPNPFTADLDLALRQQIFNISLTQIEPEIHAHRALDDIGRKSVTLIWSGAGVHVTIVA
jgi:hypothetical protein